MLQYLVSIPFGKAVTAGVVRVNTRKQTCPRRATDGCIAMCLCEPDTLFGQSRHVGCLRLRVTAEPFDIVVQIIANDKDYVGMLDRTCFCDVCQTPGRDQDTEQDRL